MPTQKKIPLLHRIKLLPKNTQGIEIYNNTISDKLIETLESQIKEQQSEIAYLRKLLEKELLGK